MNNKILLGIIALLLVLLVSRVYIDQSVIESEVRRVEVMQVISETDIPLEFDIQSEQEKRDTLLRESGHIIATAVVNRDARVLSEMAHFEGVIIDGIINGGLMRTFGPMELLFFFDNPTVYRWGTADGSGFPIEETNNDYFNRIFTHNFIVDGEVRYVGSYDSLRKMRGDAYPVGPEGDFLSAYVVEYFVPGQRLELDWEILIIVFEPDPNGVLKLRALLQYEWGV